MEKLNTIMAGMDEAERRAGIQGRGVDHEMPRPSVQSTHTTYDMHTHTHTHTHTYVD